MDLSNLNLASLQLSDFPSAKIKIDELFLAFLCESETSKLVDYLLDEVANATSSDGSTSPIPRPPPPDTSPLQPPRSPISKSPKKRSQSEMQQAGVALPADPSSPRLASVSSDDTSAQSARRRSNIDSIPPFFVPGRHRRSYRLSHADDQVSVKLNEIEACFKPYPGGIPVENFVHITKGICGLPSFFNLPLCKRINVLFPVDTKHARSSRNMHPQSSGLRITLKSFLQFWHSEMEPFDKFERFYRVIKQPAADHISKDDFVPYMQELLHFHPGLDFLESHEEFQRKYALTVIARIFYKVNLSRTGKLTLREVRGSNLFAEFMHVDEETDINRVEEFFSYEHFYVLYCRFFELDADKDSKLTKEDLMKYGEHALSEAIVDRIFQMGLKAFSDGKMGGFRQSGMTYSDFIYFMLSEEDKSNEPALRYWFACCDLDGDGVLSNEEMQFFYRAQLHRVTSLGQESINFADVLCQMIDMISPQDARAITLDDLMTKKNFSGILFDVLCNLHKFMRFETRDPFQEKQKRDDCFTCDWDRFAHMEYHRLAAEEEGYDTSMDVDDVVAQGKEDEYDSNIVGSQWLIDDDDEDDSMGKYAKNGGADAKGTSKR